MIHAITFGSEDFSISAERCLSSAMTFGATSTKEYRPALPNATRGYGYWRWKPEVILRALNELMDGNILIYSDAGVEFIEPVSIVLDRKDQDIWLFGNETLHRHWCKADIIEEIWPVSYRRSWANFDRQCQASVIFLRVNDYTRAFVKEWLDWCLFEGGRLIDDSPSRLPNHPEFKENRHDQAILTTLAYREGIKLHHWYVRYPQNTPGRGSLYPGDNYPPLFLHHRFRNHQWEAAA